MAIMVRPPAYIFVVRHGNRLDVADKQWHLTSLTPYDPPLTYGGWQQAKALGARIATILREESLGHERADGAQEKTEPAKRKQKRYKVVLHSSPFLRCIQTSIAISAGLAQDPKPLGAAVPPSNSAWMPGARPKPTIVTEVTSAGPPSSRPGQKQQIRKSVLRIDAFLGEWLTPSYYELITPPPGSVMMLASAKADLLRREDYNHQANKHWQASSQSHQSQGYLWNARSTPDSADSSDGLHAMSGLAGALPSSKSDGSDGSHTLKTAPSTQTCVYAGYVAPVPHYAVSSSSTIPTGYVAHARDACVEIDYQWDSMRAPLEWGDGGTYGEEWTAMHRRFRAGIQHLVDWYSSTDAPTDMVTRTARCKTSSSEEDASEVEDEEDMETESVVILVSHGAGCNAMIGAITHQPVLMEVNTASLTMAVRKPGELTEDGSWRIAEQAEDVSSTKSSGKLPIHQHYDLRLFANTDHLRPPGSSSASSSSPTASATISSRGRFPSATLGLNSFSFHDPGSRSSSANASLGSMCRSANAPPSMPGVSFLHGGASGGITVGSGVTSFLSKRLASVSRKASMRLWSPATSRDDDTDEEEDDIFPNFGPQAPPTPASEANTKSTASSAPERSPPRQHPTPGRSHGDSNGSCSGITLSQKDIFQSETSGLSQSRGENKVWDGDFLSTEDAERMCESSHAKRRWTVNESI